MVKQPDQSFDVDLPNIKMAAHLTKLSSDSSASKEVVQFRANKNSYKTILVDTSVLSWFLSGPGADNGQDQRKQDIDAFNDLVRLSAIRKIKLRVPMSVVDEFKKRKFSEEDTARIESLLTHGRFMLEADSISQTAGQNLYGIFESDLVDKGLDEDLAKELKSLLPSDPDPSVPKEDRSHYLMACLDRSPFVSMDYKLIARMSKAIQKQVELFEGENQQKKTPKNRPALKAPVVTPSVLLAQLLQNFPSWREKLEWARSESDCRACEDLRRELAAIGQKLTRIQNEGVDTPPEKDELKKHYGEIEEAIKSGNCCLEFFKDWPEDMKPGHWKSLE